MNTSKRIYFPKTGNTNSTKYVKFKLEQTIDTYEFLSLKVSTKEAYQNFNADFGVLIGRVVANEGVGIPNAKVSIFIPLDDNDAQNGEIRNIYPYTSPRDKDIDGKIYNLLPRVSKQDPITKIISPKQPIGSFPIKEEILTNETYLNIYQKYYKYTTVTNGSGDYMLFGVPIGVQTVHMSVDVTDIGKYSMNPTTMVTNLGYSPNFFSADGTKIKITTDLDNLPNVDTQEITVDIIPFWGDSENFEIGITRQDFKIRAILINTFTVFGTSFTDNNSTQWGQQFGSHDYGGTLAELHYVIDSPNQANNIDINQKRIGKITETIYYLPEDVSDATIQDYISNNKDLGTLYKVLDPTEYAIYKNNGDFVFIIPCNRGRIYTNELGVETKVLSNEKIGVFGEFKGFITFEITDEDVPFSHIEKDLDEGSGQADSYYWYRATRCKFKFPQHANRGQSFMYDEPGGTQDSGAIKWRNEHFTFIGSNIYSVAKFNPTVHNGTNPYYSGNQLNNGFLNSDVINEVTNFESSFRSIGLLLSNDSNIFPSNMTRNDGGNITNGYFGANWINFAIYFPQPSTYRGGNSPVLGAYPNLGTPYLIYTPSFLAQQFYGNYNNKTYNPVYCWFGQSNNKQLIGADKKNTFGFARSDLHWTDFILVPTSDINKIANYQSKGFTDSNVAGLTKSNYKNGGNSCPITSYARLNNISTNNPDTKYYFYKGLGLSDCFKYLISLNLLK
jgi:hypothetical protein